MAPKGAAQVQGNPLEAVPAGHYRRLLVLREPRRCDSFVDMRFSVSFQRIRDSLPYEYTLSIRVPVDSVVVAEQIILQICINQIAF